MMQHIRKWPVSLPELNCGELRIFSVTLFDSAKFITLKKNLAQVVSKLGVLDFRVAHIRYLPSTAPRAHPAAYASTS